VEAQLAVNNNITREIEIPGGVADCLELKDRLVSTDRKNQPPIIKAWRWENVRTDWNIF
jgi:hypothetical protein